MDDSNQLLRIGIEHARAKERQQAHDVFVLLTKREPENVQAWLWLAGVADSPEQRRQALERVLELDPDNEMARKGLEAKGVQPAAEPAAVAEPASEPESPPPAPARPMTDEERYAAELDSAFDDYDALPRAEAPKRDPAAEAAADEEARAVGATAVAGRERPIGRRPTVRVRPTEDDDDDDEPARAGRSPLFWWLLGLIAVVVIGFLLLQFFNQGSGTATVEPTSVAEATETPEGGAIGTQPTAEPDTPAPTTDPGAQAPTADPNAPAPTTDPNTPAPTADPNAPAPTADPGAPAPTAAPAGPDPAQANPAPIAIGTELESNGWRYTYPQANYALLLGNQVGGFTAQGTYLHILAFVANNTGTSQPVPADFFVLKDAQGNVYTPLPQQSSAFVQRGVTADASLEDSIPANNTITSVYLVFDIQPGATGLVLFARSNPGQGWPITPS